MKTDILKEYASLEAMETKELLQVWNRHFDAAPLTWYITNKKTRAGSVFWWLLSWNAVAGLNPAIN